MNNSLRNIVSCLTAVILLVTTSGCDWLFPLTSPSRATVDKRLLGFWKASIPTGSKEFQGVYRAKECAKLSQYRGLDDHPNLPRGAMWFTSLGAGAVLPSAATPGPATIQLVWPTQIGSTSYLNYTTYNWKTKKLSTGPGSYSIFKYIVASDNDSVTIYGLPADAKKQIKSRLGSNYNSADLLREISKQTEWIPAQRFDRIH